MSFLGLGVRILTIGHTPRKTSGRNTSKQVADKLNTTGIYSLVRHPLYLGNFIIWLGISLFAHLWWLTLICTLVFWVYYERIMFAEEEFLKKKFGKEYEDWAGNTPAFIPKMKGWKKPDLPFSMKKVLKGEYNGFFGIIAVFTILEVVGDYFAEGKLELDLMWSLIFGTGFVVFVTAQNSQEENQYFIGKRALKFLPVHCHATLLYSKHIIEKTEMKLLLRIYSKCHKYVPFGYGCVCESQK